MSLLAIIARRQQALIQAWVRNPLVLVQVESPGTLPGLVFLESDVASASVGRVGRRAAGSVAMVRGPGEPDANASAWVAAGYGSYRDAYLAFVRAAYDLPAAPGDLAGYDIDHLLNRARAPFDSTFIRIEAISSAANQAWGRLFERAASDPRFYANQHRQRRTMSWVICAKLAGELPPNGPGDTPGIQRLVRFFSSVGLSAAEAQSGLADMLSFAYKFR
jgi:hypothetical protein